MASLFLPLLSSVGPGTTPSGWDSSKLIAGTLSNSDKTFTAVNAGAYYSAAISTTGNSAGLHFVEMTMGAMVDPSSSGQTIRNDADDQGVSYLPGGAVFNGVGSFLGSVASYTTGDVIGYAVDQTANTITLYKNGVSQGSFSTTVSQTCYASALLVDTGDAATINTGPTFAYTKPSGYSDWYASSGNQTVTGALFTDADTFYAATVTPGAVTVSGSLFNDADTFYGATAKPTNLIAGTLYSDPDTFFGSTVSPGVATIVGGLFTDGDAFYSASINQAGAPQAITGALYQDADAFYGAVVTATYGIIGGLYADPDQFFGATVSQAGAAQQITGALFANGNVFFGSTVSGTPVVIRRRFIFFYNPPEEETEKPARKKRVKRRVTKAVVREALDEIIGPSPWTLDAAFEAAPSHIVMPVMPAIDQRAAMIEIILRALAENEFRAAADDEDEIEILLLLAA